MHEDEPPLRHLDPAGKHVEWAVKLNAPAGRPATVGDAVYVGNSWNVYALDAADGSERWRHDLYTPSDVVCYRGELAVADERVYAPTCENTVALYADDADLAWRASRESNGPPRIADDSVVVAGRELAALDAATGSTEWHSTFEEGFRVPPAVGSDVAVGVTQENRLVACDVADGRVRWETGVAASLPPPGVGSGTVVVEWGSADNVGFLQAYDAATGEQVWSRDTGVEGRGTRPVVADGVVYVVRSDDHLYAHDAADGEQLWSYRVGGRFHDPPMVESGRAYVGGGSGTVHVVDAATGDRLRRLDTGFDDVPTPSVDDDGTVYAAVGDRVVALDAG
jgi:outer membrane protein assembly factor BamB